MPIDNDLILYYKAYCAVPVFFGRRFLVAIVLLCFERIILLNADHIFLIVSNELATRFREGKRAR
jgi:hypothetical protein